MELGTQPETETKRCQRCRKTFAIGRFIDSDKNPDKIYTKCNDCRLKLVVRKNICETCGIRGCFNFPTETFGRYCKSHSEIGMVDVVHQKCYCKKVRPCFNIEGQPPMYCQECKSDEMINVVSPKCYCGKVRPAFNLEGQPPIYCQECKSPEMVDVVHQKCYCGKVRPAFNLEGQPPIYCQECKSPEMIDVVSPKCFCGKVQPYFNVEGQPAKYCQECRTPEMINVKHSKCYCGRVLPSFNIEGQPPMYCQECKSPEMVDVKSKKCYCGNSQRKYNIEGQPPMYCQECKSPEMINVVVPRCHCGTMATYALPGMIPKTCSKHKTTGMIIPPRKQCEANDCREFATHGIKGPVHCENHAQTDEYLLTERNCLKCSRLDILNVRGLCVNFCSLEERDRLMKKRTKKKEEFVRKLLEKEIDLKEYVIQEWQDSIIDPTCTKRRPDFVYHCGDHIVIIEVDEDQHKSYSNCGSTREEKLAGENRRMFEIFQIFQGLPVVFLRYNPDGFRVDQKVTKVADRIRHRVLVQWIKKCLREFQPGLWIKYLYYDDFKETDTHFIQIQEKDVLV